MMLETLDRSFIRPIMLVVIGAAIACRPQCEHEVRQSVTSPGGRYVATVFIENCHATSPFVTVTIRPASDELDPDDYVFAAKGSVATTVRWRSDGALVIRADESEVFRRNDRWRNVAVTYEPPPAPADATDVVPVLPTADAREVSPGIFVATVRRPSDDPPSLEDAAGFTLLETMYDAAGKEVGASVPSTTWRLLPDLSRLPLAGMRKGEIRRIWTCSGTPAERRCKVEDVEVVEIETSTTTR